jgi:hypothetical protein
VDDVADSNSEVGATEPVNPVISYFLLLIGSA